MVDVTNLRTLQPEKTYRCVQEEQRAAAERQRETEHRRQGEQREASRR